MRKNDIITIRIRDIGKNGEGIGSIEGFTFFVRDALPGDEIEAQITKLKKNYGYARVSRIITPSPDRTVPLCASAGPCGGCQLQQMTYEAQLKYKRLTVKSALERIGGFRDLEVPPVIGMETPYYYRNKAQFPVGYGRDKSPEAGFYALHSHRIIPCPHLKSGSPGFFSAETRKNAAAGGCVIGMPENQILMEAVLAWMRKYGISAYDENTGKGLVRHIMTRVSASEEDVIVCLIINGKKIPHADELTEMLRSADLGEKTLCGITYSVNTAEGNVIFGKSVKLLWGKPFITDRIGGIQFRISPQSFFQVNPVQTEKLYGKALEFAALTGNETVWDLYCGTGTISLFLAEKAKEVYGVEIVEQAVRDAGNNAGLNGIENAHFYAGAAEKVVPELIREKQLSADVVVVDPPRKGCAPSLLETILQMSPARIVYVSCDPATLARDLKILAGGGYTVDAVQPVDMFPFTMHVECVVLMSRVKD